MLWNFGAVRIQPHTEIRALVENLLYQLIPVHGTKIDGFIVYDLWFLSRSTASLIPHPTSLLPHLLSTTNYQLSTFFLHQSHNHYFPAINATTHENIDPCYRNDFDFFQS